jgi:hypothetical protein
MANGIDISSHQQELIFKTYDDKTKALQIKNS